MDNRGCARYTYTITVMIRLINSSVKVNKAVLFIGHGLHCAVVVLSKQERCALHEVCSPHKEFVLRHSEVKGSIKGPKHNNHSHCHLPRTMELLHKYNLHVRTQLDIGKSCNNIQYDKSIANILHTCTIINTMC